MARNKLRMYRAAMNYTKKKAGEMAGTNLQTYSYLETNARNGSIGMWVKIQKALNIPNEDMWNVIAEGVEQSEVKE